MGRIIRSTVTIVAASVLAVSLAGCKPHSTVSSSVVTWIAGLPLSDPSVGTRSSEPDAAWAGSRRIYVVVYGSGSCRPLPVTVQADANNRVTVKTQEQHHKGGSCTADLTATTSTVQLPKRVDVTKPVSVNIDGTAITLRPR